MPMAIDRYTEIDGVRGGDRVRLTSFDEPEPVDLPLSIDRPQDATPAWGKYVAGVVAEMSTSGRVHRPGEHRHPHRRRSVQQRCARGCGRARARPPGFGARAGAALPACREPRLGRAHRHHGPVHHRCRREGPRADDRLWRSHRHSRAAARRRRDRGACSSLIARSSAARTPTGWPSAPRQSNSSAPCGTPRSRRHAPSRIRSCACARMHVAGENRRVVDFADGAARRRPRRGRTI